MEPPRETDERTNRAIETRSLTKRYGAGEDGVLAVDALDLEVAVGEIFGFLGPNGAGKSTTIDLLLGFATPTNGTASVLGMNVQTDAERIRTQIGVLPEGLGLYDRLTGRRHLEFAIRWKDASDDPEALFDRVGLDHAAGARPVGEYSKGMQQRLALAMALVGSPELLILDEPSSGLDPHGIRRLREIVRAERDRGTTVFFSSHILGQVEAVCDRVGILSEGRLVAIDTIEGLRATVGSGTELQLRVTDGVDPNGTLAAMDGVAAVRRMDGLVRVQTTDSTAKARVVNRLTEQDVTIVDIDSTDASLEDVFTTYTTGDAPPEATGDATEAERAVMAR